MSESENDTPISSDGSVEMTTPNEPAAPAAPAIEALGVTLMDQDALEKEVADDANKMISAREKEVETKRLEKAIDKRDKLLRSLRGLETRLSSPNTRISEKERLRSDIQRLKTTQLEPVQNDVREIRERLNAGGDPSALGGTNDGSVQQLPNETRQEFLVRTGQVTAFGSSNGFIQDEDDAAARRHSHRDLLMPGLAPEQAVDAADDEDYDYGPDESDASDDDDEEIDASPPKKMRKIVAEKDEFENIDDGDEKTYRKRFKQWANARAALRLSSRPEYVDDATVPEWRKPHPTVNDAILNDEFRIPGDIYPSLFDYQRTGVQWLWELYAQKTGGIIGDEMGLGKTVQVISFLAGLHYSGKLNGPVLVVCPATVLTQWCNEFHRWWPAFRVVILHSIGTGMTKKKGASRGESDEDELEELLQDEDYDNSRRLPSGIQADKRAKDLVRGVVTGGHVILTTYVGVRIYAKHLLPVKWDYVVLDEGHKIRNPDSYVTLTCKQVRTSNRLILSGTPIQNNLVELWSLFDFVFPGRLGTLPVFQNQFCVPINIGGYANATNVQVQTGYKCAVILRELISPYLLRRVKADVAKDLPKKSEMVLFCKLTAQQRALYEKFLSSEDLSRILNGKRNALYGIDVLRKICNHPDLVNKLPNPKTTENTAAEIEEKSGKLQVVHALVETWGQEGRKTLIFTQTRQMLNILERFLAALNREKGSKFQYLRMDGTTPISQRQSLVDSFNRDPAYTVFLLTTRVGGLGVNLTGASRVIIYDPDWNPSTDIQARERAWRLGQKKDVVIYRLMMAGSIEEKIYHRQIFKQLLTNKILKDPKQKRFFKMNDLYELFTLGKEDGQRGNRNSNQTETARRFGRNRPAPTRPVDNTPSDAGEDDFLQVSSLRGVSSLQKYENGSDSDEENQEDADLMKGLFKNSNVHSALEHDSVMDPKPSAASSSVIDSEATRIASEAVRALRESRKLTRQTKVGVPTWTGRFGAAGKRPLSRKSTPTASKPPSLSPSPMISSSSILSSIKSKKEQTKANTPAPPVAETELVTKLSNYMSGLDSFFSTSADVLDNLNIDVTNEKNVKVVRSMLKTICTWDKDRKGWVLNEEFR